MGTALIYLVVLLVVAAAFFVGAAAVFGRGEELAPIPPGASPTWLPDHDVRAGHLRAVRFQQAVRGYKMAEVDWVLERLGEELDRKSGETEQLRMRVVELESAVAGAKQADVMIGLGSSFETDTPEETSADDDVEPSPDQQEPGEETESAPPPESTGEAEPSKDTRRPTPAQQGGELT